MGARGGGEQSAKALRGGKMQDVIFEGADTRRAAQMCEVSLLLTECEKQLGSEFHEIEITRRVYRDGQGEYLFNGQACRLKDIHKLFHGHRRRPDQLLHHGAGPHRPGPFVEAGGTQGGL